MNKETWEKEYLNKPKYEEPVWCSYPDCTNAAAWKLNNLKTSMLVCGWHLMIRLNRDDVNTVFPVNMDLNIHELHTLKRQW